MNAIVWTDDGSWSVLTWALRRTSILVPARKAPKPRKGRAPSDVEAPAFYSTTFQAPLKHRADFRKATELALPQLMPVALEDLLVYGRRCAEGVELVAFRKTEMAMWWKSVRPRGLGGAIRISEAWSVLPPELATAASRRHASILLAALLSVIAIVALHLTYLSLLDRELTGLLSEEQRVRSTALAVARQKEGTNLKSSLESSQATARLPAAVLASIAELSRVVPSGSAWARMEWTPSRAIIAGTAADPVTVLAALSEIRNARASFSKPIKEQGSGRQEFEVAVTYGRAPG